MADGIGDRGPGGGPYDVDALDADARPVAGVVDFGALWVPVPEDGTVTVEAAAATPLQAVHVMVGEGRLSVSALAAPKSAGLWADLAKEIDESLREGGARVRSFPGEWGRELHATTGAATSVFVGVDGPRWMLYGVATGPSRDAVALDAKLRRMVRRTVVVRGRSPYPVRTVLPLAVPPEVAAPGPVPAAPPAVGSAPTTALGQARPPAREGSPSAATAAFSAVVRAARPGPGMVAGSSGPVRPVPPAGGRPSWADPVRRIGDPGAPVDDLSEAPTEQWDPLVDDPQRRAARGPAYPSGPEPGRRRFPEPGAAGAPPPEQAFLSGFGTGSFRSVERADPGEPLRSDPGRGGADPRGPLGSGRDRGSPLGSGPDRSDRPPAEDRGAGWPDPSAGRPEPAGSFGDPGPLPDRFGSEAADPPRGAGFAAERSWPPVSRVVPPWQDEYLSRGMAGDFGPPAGDAGPLTGDGPPARASAGAVPAAEAAELPLRIFESLLAGEPVDGLPGRHAAPAHPVDPPVPAGPETGRHGGGAETPPRRSGAHPEPDDAAATRQNGWRPETETGPSGATGRRAAADLAGSAGVTGRRAAPDSAGRSSGVPDGSASGGTGRRAAADAAGRSDRAGRAAPDAAGRPAGAAAASGRALPAATSPPFPGGAAHLPDTTGGRHGRPARGASSAPDGPADGPASDQGAPAEGRSPFRGAVPAEQAPGASAPGFGGSSERAPVQADQDVSGGDGPAWGMLAGQSGRDPEWPVRARPDVIPADRAALGMLAALTERDAGPPVPARGDAPGGERVSGTSAAGGAWEWPQEAAGRRRSRDESWSAAELLAGDPGPRRRRAVADEPTPGPTGPASAGRHADPRPATAPPPPDQGRHARPER